MNKEKNEERLNNSENWTKSDDYKIMLGYKNYDRYSSIDKKILGIR